MVRGTLTYRIALADLEMLACGRGCENYSAVSCQRLNVNIRITATVYPLCSLMCSAHLRLHHTAGPDTVPAWH